MSAFFILHTHGWSKNQPKTDLYISIGDKMRLFHHTVIVLQINQTTENKI